MTARLAALVTALLLVPAAAAHAQTSLVEVPVSGPLTVAALEDLGLDVTHDVTEDRARVLLHDDADRRALAGAGYPARVLVADLEAHTRRARERDATRARQGPSELPSGRQTYRTLQEYYDDLDELAAGHPGLVRRTSLPRTSVQGRELAGVEIASNVNRTDDGRPVYVVMGAHHAREWPSAEVSMELALDLAQSYGTDERITRLLDTVRVYVFPVVNPDGFVMSRGTLPLGSGPDPMQRKNANEVDLNRNYGAYWGGNGASTNPASDTYRGPSPWSEPEAQAVHELSRRLHITNFQSIHNVAALVLRPPGFRALGLAPDEERLKALGDAMGEATGYSSEYGYQLYEVTGATEDWNYVAQNAFGYTIELGPAGAPTFQGPYLTHVVQQYLGTDPTTPAEGGVREALLLAGEQAGDPRDHSVLSGETVPGATLRLTRGFTTETSPVCEDPSYSGGSSECVTRGPALQLPDGLDTQLTVPASGSYTWHITPSTRPFVRKAGGTEAWTLTCTAPGGSELARRELVIALGEHLVGDPCTPGPAFGRPGSTGAAPSSSPAPAAPAAGVTAVASGSAGPLFRLTVRLPSRQLRSDVLRRGLLVRATCTVDCRLVSAAHRSRRAAGRRLGRRSVALRAGKQRAFRVRLSRAARRAVVRRRVSRTWLRFDARARGASTTATGAVRLVRR